MRILIYLLLMLTIAFSLGCTNKRNLSFNSIHCTHTIIKVKSIYNETTPIPDSSIIRFLQKECKLIQHCADSVGVSGKYEAELHFGKNGTVKQAVFLYPKMNGPTIQLIDSFYWYVKMQNYKGKIAAMPTMPYSGYLCFDVVTKPAYTKHRLSKP